MKTRTRRPQLSRPSLLVLLTAVVFAAGDPTSASGAVIVVTTLEQRIAANDGLCSLQEAIWAANLDDSKAVVVNGDSAETIETGCVAGSGDDVIVLPQSAHLVMTFVVDDPYNYLGPTATPLVYSTITIEGNGARLEHAPNGINFRAFAVGSADAGGSVSAGNLTLRNVHVKGFTVKGGDGVGGGGGGLGAGGAIYVHGGGLTVESSTFEMNGAMGGNGSVTALNTGGGGGGGLSGNGGRAGNGGHDQDLGGGGGGGGGVRGDGGSGMSECGTPCVGLGASGGGGGGTVRSGENGSINGDSAGGFLCGGQGGHPSLNPLESRQDGEDGPCAGGGGGGGRDSFVTFAEILAGNGGDGAYGGGGGGGGGLTIGGDGGRGGFGGGGGAAPASSNPPPFICSPNGGDGGFGGGAGAGPGGIGPVCVTYTGPGRPGTFGGDASDRQGGGGAGLGGAIFNHAGTVAIRNSTFAGNFAVRGLEGGPEAGRGNDRGGAILSVAGSLTVIHSTFAANETTSAAVGGAGIVVYRPTTGDATSFALHNSILANPGGVADVTQCSIIGSVSTTGSGNLIQGNGGCPGDDIDGDPGLGPLSLNPPGLTPTMAIGPDSPAVDAADTAHALDTDQRGSPRPIGDAADAGAYEWGNLPPVAVCRDVTLSAGPGCSASASVDGGSFDPDGQSITLAQSPPGAYALGMTMVTLTVTDTLGASSSCTAVVTVVDTTAPVITTELARPTLQPSRNHDLVNVGLAASAADECSAPPTAFDVAIYGDEDDQAPTAPDTVFSPDATDIAVSTLRLRAERAESSDGRVYLLVVRGEDAAGNDAVACDTVVVPHNASRNSAASASIQAAEAEAFCQAHGGTPPGTYFLVGDGPEIGPKD